MPLWGTVPVEGREGNAQNRDGGCSTRLLLISRMDARGPGRPPPEMAVEPPFSRLKGSA